MAQATRTIGEVVTAVTAGKFVRVKGVGILVLTNGLGKRTRRTRAEMEKDEKGAHKKN